MARGRVSMRKRLLAYHEAGHAMAAVAWGGNIEYVTVKRQERLLGHFSSRVLKDPPKVHKRMNDDIRLAVQWEILKSARIHLAGHAGEHVLTGEAPLEVRAAFGRSPADFFESLGDEHDLVRARQDILRAYLKSSERLFSLRLQKEYGHAYEFLAAHRPVLNAMATGLLERETLDRDEIHEVLPSVDKRWALLADPRGITRARR